MVFHLICKSSQPQKTSPTAVADLYHQQICIVSSMGKEKAVGGNTCSRSLLSHWLPKPLSGWVTWMSIELHHSITLCRSCGQSELPALGENCVNCLIHKCWLCLCEVAYLSQGWTSFTSNASTWASQAGEKASNLGSTIQENILKPSAQQVGCPAACEVICHCNYCVPYTKSVVCITAV